MLFHSLQFLAFFPVVVLIYFIVPRKIKNMWLLAASYYFYMCWNAKYALLLLFSTVITYISGLLMEKVKQNNWGMLRKIKYKKIIVGISFGLNLAVLFYYKYINFALNTLSQILRVVHIDLIP